MEKEELTETQLVWVFWGVMTGAGLLGVGCIFLLTWLYHLV